MRFNLLPDFDTVVSPAVRCSVHGRAKGGLFIALNSKFYKVKKLSIDLNHIFVRIQSNNEIFILGLIYFPPDNDFKDFFDGLNLTLSLITEKISRYAICFGGWL